MIPQEINERRSYLMPQFKDAKRMNNKPKWNVDKLIINGQSFSQPKDEASFSTAILTTDSDTLIRHGEIHSEVGSSFQGHSTKIEDQSQVIPTMHLLFSNHAVAKATHNIYAYRIKTATRTIENSCDDGEYGAGKRVLELMRELNITNQMVIVTRWYGGQHMGPRRFNCILNAAKEVIS